VGDNVVKCATTIRFLAWLVNRTPTATDQLANWNKTVQFSLSGEDPFYVTFADNRMKYTRGVTAKPDLEFVSNSKDFLDVMTGKTKFDQGFSTGTYTIHGSITNAVRLMRVAEIAFESHPIMDRLVRAASKIFE
jgi:putative sterol carrier protein